MQAIDAIDQKLVKSDKKEDLVIGSALSSSAPKSSPTELKSPLSTSLSSSVFHEAKKSDRKAIPKEATKGTDGPKSQLTGLTNEL